MTPSPPRSPWRLVLPVLSGVAAVVVIVTGVVALAKGCSPQGPSIVGSTDVNDFSMPPQYSGVGETRVGHAADYRLLVVTTVRNLGRSRADDVELLYPSDGIARVEYEDGTQATTPMGRNVAIGNISPQRTAKVLFWTYDRFLNPTELRLVASNGTGRLQQTERLGGASVVASRILEVVASMWYVLIPALALMVLLSIGLIMSFRGRAEDRR